MLKEIKELPELKESKEDHLTSADIKYNEKIEKSNLIYITPRQHFICHWLLIKIYSTGEEHWKMLNALRMMRAENPNQKRYHTKITSRVYERLKLEYAALQSERMRGENNPMYQRPVSEEVRKGRSLRARGDNNPAKKPGVGEKIRQSKLGKKRPKFDEEWLVVITTDHGHLDEGGHGGESDQERSSFLIAYGVGRKNPQWKIPIAQHHISHYILDSVSTLAS
mgnify:CR=1 FL=1